MASQDHRRARFIREYLKDLNATQAAIRAGYSSKTANQQSSRLLANVKIRAEIDRLIAERAERLQMTADNVLREIARVAFAQADRYGKWGPTGLTLFSSKRLTPDDVAAISEISSTKHGPKVKFHSKTRALDQAAKHLGLYKDRDPIDVLLSLAPPELAGPLREAYGRVLAERRTGEAGGSGP
jgi:phage terminase small subunit